MNAALLVLLVCGAGLVGWTLFPRSGAKSSAAVGSTTSSSGGGPKPSPTTGSGRGSAPGRGSGSGGVTAAGGPTSSSPSSVASTPPQHRMFAFYYLWWDIDHWHARLGSNYPYNQSPLPLPATLDSSGCNPTSNYPGNQLTDVAPTLFTQADPAQILRDVQEAASSGLAGFAVAWEGTGLAGQNANSNLYNQRLAMVVQAVHQVNAAGTPFKLWVAYMSSASIRTTSQIDNDLGYLSATYGSDPAFDRTNSSRPTLVFMGSRKYPQSVLDGLSAQWRPSFYLVGDENWGTWDAAKAADFDADQYYWSSEPPSPKSYSQLAQLAGEVRASRNPDGSPKRFFSPLAPGYDKQLAGGADCVARNGGQTMRNLYSGNLSTRPDGWMVISWNEIDEGTYILPLERYGTQSMDTLHTLIRNG